jgi:hypothetical protein
MKVTPGPWHANWSHVKPGVGTARGMRASLVRIVRDSAGCSSVCNRRGDDARPRPPRRTHLLAADGVHGERAFWCFEDRWSIRHALDPPLGTNREQADSGARSSLAASELGNARESGAECCPGATSSAYR